MPLNQKFADLHPTDEASHWGDATDTDRLAFYRRAGERAVELNRAELQRGIGANGRRLAARKRPCADGATGPALLPHRDESRTIRLMASRPTASGVTLFWHSGHSKVQKTSWGAILGFHAAGEVKGAPVRDVRLSPKGIERLRVEMRAWWANHHAPRLRRAAAERIAAQEAEEKAARRAERRKRGVVPKVAAKAKAAMVRRYPGLAPYLGSDGRGL